MEKTVTVKETKGWISARKGIIVDIPNKKMFKGIVHHKNGKVLSIEPAEHDCNEYIMPGFLDSHIHIESSMLVPTEFAWIALKHGTVGTISDPHEIANVLGVKGVEYMMDVKTKSGLMMVERNVQPSVLHFARVDSARQRVLESATWAVIQLIMVKNAPKHARKPHARRIARNPTVRVPGEHVISYHLHHTARMILTQAVTLRGFAFRPASQAITVLNARKSVLTIVRLLVLRIRQSVHPVK